MDQQPSDASDSQPSEIFLAATGGRWDRFKALLEADPGLLYFKDRYNNTPLTWASMYGQASLVKFILDRLKPGDARDCGLNLALQTARSGEIAALLLDHGADLQLATNGWTALHNAATSGLTDVVELLLSRKAQVNLKNCNGWAPLHLAAYYDRVDAARLLLAHGAEIDLRDEDARTPLQGAAYYARGKMIELLVAHGAELEARDKDGLTPLHWAALEGKPEAAEALLVAGANINARTNRNITPYFFEKTDEYYIPLLTYDEATPLHLALSLRRKEMPDVLRRHGAV